MVLFSLIYSSVWFLLGRFGSTKSSGNHKVTLQKTFASTLEKWKFWVAGMARGLDHPWVAGIVAVLLFELGLAGL